MNMYEKYLKLLEANNCKTSDVSRLTKIDPSTFSHWKAGDYQPKPMTIKKIAECFGVPMSYFYGDDSAFDPKTTEHHIPHQVFEVSAGEGRSCSAPDSYKKEDGEYAKVVGDSMLPTLRNGDVVRIIEAATVEPSDYALVKINGDENTIKHAEVTKEGVWIRAENKEVFEDRFYSVEECLTLPVQIVGKAVELVSRML